MEQKKLSPGLPSTHPETSTTSESVWASLLNEREDPRPREETPGREGAKSDVTANERTDKDIK